MPSRINLVVIALVFVCFGSGLNSLRIEITSGEVGDASSSNLFMTGEIQNLSRKLKNRVSIIGGSKVTSNISPSNKIPVVKTVSKRRPQASTAIAVKTNKHEIIHDLGSKTRTALERRRSKIKYKKTRNRVLMALLLAYKLKFAALIPTIIGGLALLVSTTALAGFFYALFAAVLGLKTH